jgi:hypothetical protein
VNETHGIHHPTCTFGELGIRKLSALPRSV